MGSKRSSDQNTHFELRSKDDPWPETSGQIFGWRMLKRSHLWRPPTDVVESESSYEVVVEIAGMRGADFSITYNQKVLSVQGTRTETSSRKAYHQMEIAYGEFVSEVELSSPVDASQIEATYNDGFLRIVMPKLKPSQVQINDNS
jgi:HSP20 family protein